MPRYIEAGLLIERMRKRYAEICDTYGYHDLYASGYDDAVDAVENSPAADVSPKSAWISVDERLPKDDGAVVGIVRGKRRNVELRDAIELVCYFADEGVWALWDDARVTIQVTYWMPLPEPPKMKGV